MASCFSRVRAQNRIRCRSPTKMPARYGRGQAAAKPTTEQRPLPLKPGRLDCRRIRHRRPIVNHKVGCRLRAPDATSGRSQPMFWTTSVTCWLIWPTNWMLCWKRRNGNSNKTEHVLNTCLFGCFVMVDRRFHWWLRMIADGLAERWTEIS